MCGCGNSEIIEMVFQFPLTVESIDASEKPDFIVWLKSGENHYVSVVADARDCPERAELIVEAFKALLSTPEGQEKARAFIEHDLQINEIKPQLVQ
jgi:hypothetical protein